MADNEIRAQIDKLRKTRPARAVEALMGEADDASSRDLLIVALSMLRDDLREEARLLEVSKIKGAVTIMKDRSAVAGWLELFVLQLGREGEAPEPITPSERLSPSPELTEHRPSERGSDAALLPGPGGRCAVGNVHDESTLKCPCGLDRTASIELASAAVFPPSPEKIADSKAITDYLSGVSDTLPARSEHRCPKCDLQVQHDTSNVACPHCAAADAADIDAAAYIGDALAPAEQAMHDTIDRELAHVTADPVVDPFAPIPRAVWAPAVPPNGRAWTSADLLVPVLAAAIPAHLSFSQATTVVECGAKYRMQRIANVPQVPQWANVGGTTFHTCVETIETKGHTEFDVRQFWEYTMELEIISAEQASGMTREQFRASGQGREGYDWWRVEGAAMLQRYVDWRQGAGAGQQLLSGPSGAPMLEWETTYAVDGVSFKTILDSVWTTAGPPYAPEVSAVIRDWKTGSMTPDNRQLCTQAWGLRKAGWQGPILVQFFDARKGTFSEPFDPFDAEQGGMSWEDVRYFVLSADAQRHLPVLPARPSDFCGGCPVAYACPIMGQRRAAKVAK